MSYDGQIVSRVWDKFDKRNQEKERRMAQRKAEVYAKDPSIAEIETQIKLRMLKIIRSAVTKGGGEKAVLESKSWVAEQKVRQSDLLVEVGYPSDWLTSQNICQVCEDSGRLSSGEYCQCFKREYVKEQLEELSQILPVFTQTFEKFRLDVYSTGIVKEYSDSPRSNMSANLDVCRDFAERFEVQTKSLLLAGSAGLGKTFLASCIAERVTQSCRSVMAVDAIELFKIYERGKFSYDEDIIADVDKQLSRYYSCDLLIIEGLGTEMRSPMVNTSLYTMLQTRISRGKKLVICTGLDENEELPKRYSPQVVSRFKGDFIALPFFGSDVREKLRGW